MDFKPVLLEASLRAIFDRLSLTLGARIERNELLLKLSCIPMHVIAVSVSLRLPLKNFFLQWTHFILALAYMNNFIIRRNRDLV
jgi:hypothetical protein